VIRGRTCYALAGVTISPALLTSDLGMPSRVINMMRMVKVTSPMSLGSWTLVASGSTTGLVVANQLTGSFPRASRLARPLAALLGLPLSTYRAALIADTAVPVWHEARAELPFVRVRCGVERRRGGRRDHAARTRGARAPPGGDGGGARDREQAADGEAAR
jgi:hypothetical protein